MKYLLTKNNHKPDFAYENALYFINNVVRDNYINEYLFDNNITYQKEIKHDVISDSINQDGTGKIVIKPDLSRQELYNKNYIIIRECELDNPEFYFITNIRPLDNRPGEYSLELQKDMITSYPGFLEGDNTFNLLEGHIAEQSVLDMTFDGGYKIPKSIRRLERDIDPELKLNDSSILNTDWLYLFIKKPSTGGETIPNVKSSKYFTYENQLMPYRVLLAPLTPIQMKAGTKKVLSNDAWAMRSDTPSTLQNEQVMPLLQPIDFTQPLSLTFNGSIDGNTNESDSTAAYIEFSNKILNIPADVLQNAQDDWVDIEFVGPTDSVGSKLSEYKINIQMKVTTNDIRFRSDSTSTNVMRYVTYYDGYPKGSQGSIEQITYYTELTSTSERLYLNTILSSYGQTVSNTTDLIQSTDVSPDDAPYFKTKGGYIVPPYDIETISDIAFIKLEVEQAYQGDSSGVPDEFWTSAELIDLINAEYNAAADDSTSRGIVGGKISSFNPLVLSPSEQGSNEIVISNVSIEDRINTTPIGWQNGKVIELLNMNIDDISYLNTYDLTQYQDKSWIKNLNNYSIGIENNALFEISPEQVFIDGKFVHSVMPTPNEWTERLVFGRTLHDITLEFANNKEFIFGTNVLADYQLNNPGVLNNEQAKNNTSALKSAVTLGGGILSAITTGGASAVLSGALITGGINSTLDAKQSKRTLNTNIASMENQPPISSGSGSAYNDLYFNKYGFGLTIIEWQYTTPQAESVIESVIRNGVNINEIIIANFNNIKRPEFNYLRLYNGLETLNNLDNINNPDKANLSNILESGVRLWYNPENFLNYNVDNGNEYFNRNMISYISQQLNRA